MQAVHRHVVLHHSDCSGHVAEEFSAPRKDKRLRQTSVRWAPLFVAQSQDCTHRRATRRVGRPARSKFQGEVDLDTIFMLYSLLFCCSRECDFSYQPRPWGSVLLVELHGRVQSLQTAVFESVKLAFIAPSGPSPLPSCGRDSYMALPAVRSCPDQRTDVSTRCPPLHAGGSSCA